MLRATPPSPDLPGRLLVVQRRGGDCAQRLHRAAPLVRLQRDAGRGLPDAADHRRRIRKAIGSLLATSPPRRWRIEIGRACGPRQRRDFSPPNGCSIRCDRAVTSLARSALPATTECRRSTRTSCCCLPICSTRSRWHSNARGWRTKRGSSRQCVSGTVCALLCFLRLAGCLRPPDGRSAVLFASCGARVRATRTLVSAIGSEAGQARTLHFQFARAGAGIRASNRSKPAGSTIDLFHRTVSTGRRRSAFDAKEYAVLAELAKHRGRVLTSLLPVATVWGPAQERQIEYLRVAIRSLRQKLERDPGQAEDHRQRTGGRLPADRLSASIACEDEGPGVAIFGGASRARRRRRRRSCGSRRAAAAASPGSSRISRSVSWNFSAQFISTQSRSNNCAAAGKTGTLVDAAAAAARNRIGNAIVTLQSPPTPHNAQVVIGFRRWR